MKPNAVSALPLAFLLSLPFWLAVTACGGGSTSSGGSTADKFVNGMPAFESDVNAAIDRMGGRSQIPNTNVIRQGSYNGQSVANLGGETLLNEYYTWEDIVFILAHEDKHHEQRARGEDVGCNNVNIEIEANAHACLILKSVPGADSDRVNYLCSFDGRHNDCGG